MFTGRALGPLNHPDLILLQGWGKNCTEETWRLGRIKLGGGRHSVKTVVFMALMCMFYKGKY